MTDLITLFIDVNASTSFEINSDSTTDEIYLKVAELYLSDVMMKRKRQEPKFSRKTLKKIVKYFRVLTQFGEELYHGMMIRETSIANGDTLTVRWYYSPHEIIYSIKNMERICQDPTGFDHLELKTEILLFKAVRKYPRAVERVEQTEELCKKVMGINYKTYYHIEDQFKTIEIKLLFLNSFYKNYYDFDKEDDFDDDFEE